MRRLPVLSVLAPLLFCAGCSGWQSALDPQGPQAGSLRWLIFFIVAVCFVVWLLVTGFLAGALRRRKTERPPLEIDRGAQRRLTVFVSAAVAATVATITLFTFVSFSTTRALTAGEGEPLVIRLRASQWWWEATYPDARPDRSFVTANELHVPVGRPVRVELASADVIHSFWVPSLAGKMDMLPGRANALSFTAARAGTYRGQCAEFCGLQHAHMALLIVAEEPAVFEAWRAAQIAPATAMLDAEEALGRDVFLQKACAACHTVRGTPAAGTLGPDLTHVGGRRTVAAGLVETTRGSLAAWIADPQTMKPGANMPAVSLSASELKAVSAYMAALK